MNLCAHGIDMVTWSPFQASALDGDLFDAEMDSDDEEDSKQDRNSTG